MSARKKILLADIELAPAFSRVVTDEISRKLLYYLTVVGEASTYKLAKQASPNALKEKYDTVRRRLQELEGWGIIASKKSEGREESGLPKRIYFRTYYELFDIWWAEGVALVGRREAGPKMEKKEQDRLAQILRSLFSHPSWVEAFAVIRDEYGLNDDEMYPSSPNLMSERLPLVNPFDFDSFHSMLEAAVRRKFVGMDPEIGKLIEEFLITWGRGTYTLFDFVEFRPYLPERVKQIGIAEGFVPAVASPSASRLLTSPLDFSILLFLHEGRHTLEDLAREFDLTVERAEQYCEERREAGLLEREVTKAADGKEKKIYRLPVPQTLLLAKELQSAVEDARYGKGSLSKLNTRIGRTIDRMVPLWLKELREYRRAHKITAPIPESFLGDFVLANIREFYGHVADGTLVEQAMKIGIPVVPTYDERAR